MDDKDFFTQKNWVAGAPVEMAHKLPSVTVPGQSYTIAELMERHMAGLLTDTTMPGVYPDNDEEFGDVDIEKLRDADFVDRDEFLQAGRDAMAEAEAINARAREEKAKADAEAARLADEARIAAEAEKRIKSRRKGGDEGGD